MRLPLSATLLKLKLERIWLPALTYVETFGLGELRGKGSSLLVGGRDTVAHATGMNDLHGDGNGRDS